VKRLLYVLPVVAFAAMAFFLFRVLLNPAPQALPSALVDKPAPTVEVPPLDGAAAGFGPRQLKAGHVSVVNVWASWCAPCRSEAPILAELAKDKDIALYGLVQKDAPVKARAFLHEVGNPFSRIGLDADGRTSIEWGVYGVPETFVVDGKGIVRARLVGEITEDRLKDELLPAIAAARENS